MGTSPTDPEQQLIEDIASFSKDPLGWVYYSFEWGKGDLLKHEGPDGWQVEILTALRDGLLTFNQAIQLAVTSGHGIGKSALVAWLILWAISTFEDTKGVVTANTETQLKTKTWAELAKWYRLFIAKHWFTFTATAIYSSDAEHEKTWRVDMVPWSERNTEAFAGLHNQGKRIVLVFDEGSAIPDIIWEVSEGALTDEETEIIWAVFGNPTRNQGRFKECFGRFKHRWKTKQIDSRDVKITNKGQIQQWVDDYGEDSDFVRVRVRGVFPRAGSNQFIPGDAVERCRHYKSVGHEHMPMLLGVDVARFGDDQTVITLRQGRKVWPQWKYRGKDTMEVAALVVEKIREFNPHAIFVDVIGIGAGVVDRLKQLGYGRELIAVNVGEAAYDKVAYFNKRAEVWGRMRDYLKEGAELPPDNDLDASLTAPEYGFTPKQQIQLEKKEDMKKRGLSSPDEGDSLALTFSEEVNPFMDEDQEDATDDSRSTVGGY